MKKQTKIILIIIILIVIIAIGVVGIILLNKNDNISYDENEISLLITNYYALENVTEQADIEPIQFGLNEDYYTRTTILSNFDINTVDLENFEFTPIMIVLVEELDKNEVKSIKEQFEGYLTGLAFTETDPNLQKLFETGIVESGKDYVYMIISSKSEDINNEIKNEGKK